MLAKKTLVYAIASDTSTRSAESTSSGCCSSKSSSKSSTKSKSSKKSRRTTCQACKKGPVKDEKPMKDRIERDKTASQKSVVVQDPKNLNSSSVFDGKFICNKDYVFPGGERKVKDFRTSRASIPPIVQPVIGVCTDGRCGGTGGGGEKLLQVRYSIVRISTFSDYTTYEVLKSSTKKPKKLPAVVEGIFVTKR